MIYIPVYVVMGGGSMVDSRLAMRFKSRDAARSKFRRCALGKVVESR